MHVYMGKQLAEQITAVETCLSQLQQQQHAAARCSPPRVTLHGHLALQLAPRLFAESVGRNGWVARLPPWAPRHTWLCHQRSVIPCQGVDAASLAGPPLSRSNNTQPLAWQQAPLTHSLTHTTTAPGPPATAHWPYTNPVLCSLACPALLLRHLCFCILSGGAADGASCPLPPAPLPSAHHPGASGTRNSSGESTGWRRRDSWEQCMEASCATWRAARDGSGRDHGERGGGRGAGDAATGSRAAPQWCMQSGSAFNLCYT